MSIVKKPARPGDFQLANIIDKLAEFVARNGISNLILPNFTVFSMNLVLKDLLLNYFYFQN